jgi:uncharacterized protein
VHHLLTEGINFFNSGRYFEAHEAWEDLWRGSQEPVRLFYQGLIQAAVGLHHLARGNFNGANAQLFKAIAKLEQYPDAFLEIDNKQLAEDLRHARQEMTPRDLQIQRL